MFSNIKLAVLSILSFAILAQLAVGVALLPTDENQLISTLKAATALSQEMQRALDSWSSSANSAEISAVVSLDFTRIDQRLQANIVVLSASDPYTDKDAAPAVVALHNFTNIHIKMLQTLIAKQHLVAATPGLGAPIYAALRNHQHIFSNFGGAVIAILPTRKDAVTKDVNAVEDMIEKALATK